VLLVGKEWRLQIGSRNLRSMTFPTSRWCRRVAIVSLSCARRLILALPLASCAVSSDLPQKSQPDMHAVTVANTIEMTRVAGDPHYYDAGSLPPLAYFSMDGSQFVVVLRKGNLKVNQNEYSMLLFRTEDAFRSSKPELLVSMSTSSNDDAIRDVRWLSNDIIAFIGEEDGRSSQVYTLDLKTRHLEQRTRHLTSVLAYRVNVNEEILFLAEANSREKDKNKVEKTGITVAEEPLVDILSENHSSPSSPELFRQEVGRSEVELRGKELPKEERIPGQVSGKHNREVATATVSVTVEEDMNTPQKLYITDLRTKRKAMFLDLNPQFSRLNFAKIELVTWKGTDGKDVLNGGGLYFPQGYMPGTRYPLVILTHHFQEDLFMIDGPWGSGYAAQPLAAKGFVVLAVHHAVGFYDHGPTEASSEMAMYEGAIDYLDERGLIDRNRVGVFSFSRTVYHLAYTMTHSQYRIAAAIMEEGVDGGYIQYITSPFLAKEYEPKYGGPAWGPARDAWMRDAPGFNLDRVKSPIRIMEHGRAGALEQWEWFSGLRLLHRPVEMVLLPNAGSGEHLLKKPYERLISAQGAVDWFCFWLKGEEDPDAAKAEQYTRWRELKRLQEENEKRASRE